ARSFVSNLIGFPGLLVGGVGCVLRRSWVSQVTFGSGRVEDESSGLGVFLLGDCWEGAEELVGNVGEDGGTARGDFVLREEEEQTREEVVDLSGGSKVVEVGGEGGGDFSGIRLIGREGRVGWAEVWARAGGVEAAAPAVGKTIGATGGAVDKAGVRCLQGHLEFPFEIDLEKTGGNAEIAESKGI